jgi:hypothetical protein
MPLSKESSQKGCSQQNPPKRGGNVSVNNPRAKNRPTYILWMKNQKNDQNGAESELERRAGAEFRDQNDPLRPIASSKKPVIDTICLIYNHQSRVSPKFSAKYLVQKIKNEKDLAPQAARALLAPQMQRASPRA